MYVCCQRAIRFVFLLPTVNQRATTTSRLNAFTQCAHFFAFQPSSSLRGSLSPQRPSFACFWCLHVVHNLLCCLECIICRLSWVHALVHDLSCCLDNCQLKLLSQLSTANYVPMTIDRGISASGLTEVLLASCWRALVPPSFSRFFKFFIMKCKNSD